MVESTQSHACVISSYSLSAESLADAPIPTSPQAADFDFFSKSNVFEDYNQAIFEETHLGLKHFGLNVEADMWESSL